MPASTDPCTVCNAEPLTLRPHPNCIRCRHYGPPGAEPMLLSVAVAAAGSCDCGPWPSSICSVCEREKRSRYQKPGAEGFDLGMFILEQIVSHPAVAFVRVDDGIVKVHLGDEAGTIWDFTVPCPQGGEVSDHEMGWIMRLVDFL